MRLTADRLKQAYPALYRGRNGKAPDFAVDVRPLKDDIVHDSRLSLNLLLGAVTLILLLACANTMHTRLAQALTRRREFAIRSAIGASRPRLIRQLLVENLLLALLAGGLAMCFAFAVLHIAIAELPEVNPLLLNPSLNGRIFAFAGILLVGITALLGLAAALTSSGRSSRLALHSKGASEDARQGRLRSMLIVGQVALAVVLVIGAGLLVRSLVSLQNAEKGFSPENVLTMRLHLVFTVERTLAQPSQAYQKMLDSIARVPGVKAAAFVTSLPLRGGVPTSFSIPDRDQGAAEASKRIAQYQIASPEYFSVLRIPLIAGRGLSDEDTADRPQGRADQPRDGAPVLAGRKSDRENHPGGRFEAHHLRSSRRREVIGHPNLSRFADLRPLPAGVSTGREFSGSGPKRRHRYPSGHMASHCVGLSESTDLPRDANGPGIARFGRRTALPGHVSGNHGSPVHDNRGLWTLRRHFIPGCAAGSGDRDSYGFGRKESGRAPTGFKEIGGLDCAWSRPRNYGVHPVRQIAF
jgi:hypothetical protein